MAWENYQTIANPEDRQVSFGQFNLGKSKWANALCTSEVKSFKDAFEMGEFRNPIVSAKILLE
jgi:hypothetical protein